jgi:REP element-mobilizing transposase RayT
MSDTYTQLYIQLVFAVKYRERLVAESFRDELEKYICGVINNKSSKPLAIYCMPDHTHILIGLNPTLPISDLVRDVKSRSSVWINEQKLVTGSFKWQEGFGAFSYSRSSLDNVVKYIRNQPQHHSGQSFKDEYIGLLNDFKIEYNNQYLFDWIMDTPV